MATEDRARRLFEAVLKANDELLDVSFAARDLMRQTASGEDTKDTKALRALEAEICRIRLDLYDTACEFAGAPMMAAVASNRVPAGRPSNGANGRSAPPSPAA